jgi:hypothetical protein
VFRSTRRPVVFPQAEHARMAGAIAAAWRAEAVPLPFDSFVRGVTLHDRGYGELDGDELGVVSAERWAEIQLRGFRARSGDAVTDLVVALHIRRLIGDDTHPARVALAAEIDGELPRLRDEAGAAEEHARTADAVTELCDRIAFAFCFEEAASGTVGGIAYDCDGTGRTTLDPWPLAVPQLRGVVVGFEADGYPGRLEPVVALFAVEPVSAARRRRASRASQAGARE